mgnify:FL=1
MIRVIVVENDRAIAESISGWVVQLWPDAVLAVESEATAAQQRWQASGADLILLDWAPPKTAVINFMRAIRRSEARCACVLVSGRPDTEIALAARQCRVDGYFRRPLSQKQVKACLAQIIAAPVRTAEQDVAFGSIEDLIQFQLTQGALGLPIAADLVDAIERIRQLGPGERVDLLHRCQSDPALVFHLMAMANDRHLGPGPNRSAGPIETFEGAMHQIGLDRFIGLATEIALYPGSDLRDPLLRRKSDEFRRDSLRLADIVGRIALDVEVNLALARSACALYRIGELSLLQIMQTWIDRGHALDEAACVAILRGYRARVGNRIKVQWNLPQSIRARIGSVYLLPDTNTRQDATLMRIAGLLYEGDPEGELPRLLARIGLVGAKASAYRPDAFPFPE